MKFPEPIKDKSFLVLIILCYMVFPSTPEFNHTWKFCLFKNDLSDEFVTNWLANQIIAEIFIFLLSWQACGLTQNRLLKSIFYAIMLDSIYTSVLAILFGYDPSVCLGIVRYSFVILAMLYAYYILHTKK